MLNNLQQSEPHDYTDNIFIGKVVYNQDPLKLKRVKCSIIGLFEEDDPAKLPWIAPMFFAGPVAHSGGAGGAHLVPAVGAELVIEFQMGSPLHGLYVGSAFRPGNFPAEFSDADWEWTYGWKDPAGNLFIVNTKTGTNTIRMFHASGTEFKVLNNGDIQVHGVHDETVTIDNNLAINVSGRADITVQGECVLTSSTHVQVTAPSIDLN